MFRRAAVGPDRIELGVVQLQPAAIGLAGGQTEVLHDLAETDGAGLHVRLELLRRHLAEARSDVPEVDVREDREPVLVLRRADDLQILTHLLSRDAARIAGGDHDAQVQRVHRVDHALHRLGRRQRRRVPVHVDHGELGARHQMLRERRAWTWACTRGCSEAGPRAGRSPLRPGAARAGACATPSAAAAPTARRSGEARPAP